MFKISLFFILLLGISNTAVSQVSVYSCGSFGVLTEEVINQSEPEYYGTCIEFNDDNYSFSNGQYNIVTASESIHLQDGFHAGQYTNGQMHLRLGEKSDFDVAVMNYPDLDGVLKFEKFELGIDLPTDIQTKVDNFVNNAVVPNSEKLNPYLDWEIRVYTKFNHYSSGEEIIIDGFYTQEFTEYMNPIPPLEPDGMSDAEYNALGGYILNPNQYSFRTRFAPTQTGLWKAQVFIVRSGITEESAPFNFIVIDSENKGYVHTSINGRYLELGDKTFIPIGCNAPWPRTEYVFDPELCVSSMALNDSTQQLYRITEEYRGWTKLLPRVYDKYKETLQNMINGGANAFRIIMIPFAFGLEYGKLGNYTDHLTQAQEMDQLFDFLRQNNVYVNFNTDVQFSFMIKGSATAFTYTWESGGIWGDHNCYKDIDSINTPLDFFSVHEAKKYYKQKLRYILARWGYSTQISILELMSEENQVGNNTGNNADHTVGLQYSYVNNVSTYENWNREMGAYIKSFHNGKTHLLTCSYAGLPHENDNTYLDPNFDVIGLNAYDDGRISFGAHSIQLLSKFLLNRQASGISPNGYGFTKNTFEFEGLLTKPIVFAETGFSLSTPDIYDYDCNHSLVEFKRKMWQMLFSGVAGSYLWTAWNFPQLYPEFNYLKQFINQFDFGDVNELWIPGASISDNYTNGGDYYSFVEEAYDHMENEEKYRADMVYMVKKDRSRAVGVITNKTYNYYTSSQNTDCFIYPINYDHDYNGIPLGNQWEPDYGLSNKYILNKYTLPYTIFPFNHINDDEYEHSFAIDVVTNNLELGLSSSNLALWNMNNADYFFQIRNHSESLNTFNSEVFNASGSNNKVNINITVNGNENEFIRTFDATEVLNSGMAQNNLSSNNPQSMGLNTNEKSTEEETKLFSIYPNPSKGIYHIYSDIVIAKIEVNNLAGNLLLQKVTDSNMFDLDLSSYLSGSYLFKIQFEDGTFKQIKIIKL